MKSNGIIAALLAVFCIAVLGACFTDWNGPNKQGTISIDLGASGSNEDPPPWINEDTQCTIILTPTDSNEKPQTYTASYGELVTIEVPPGTWDIKVLIKGKDWTQIEEGYATSVQVGTGITKSVWITMRKTSDWKKLRNAFESAKEGETFEINLNNFSPDTKNFEPVTLNKTGVTVTLDGKGKIIKLDDTVKNSLFVVKAGKLTLVDVTLQGHEKNKAPLIEVEGKNAILFMGDGATITGNYNNDPDNDYTKDPEDLGGGGVRVTHYGKFIMDDGALITGNHAKDGAGVKLNYGATLEMNGSAKIYKNLANVSGGTAGGVHVWGGILDMRKGGIISENESNGKAGGIYVGGFQGNGGKDFVYSYSSRKGLIVPDSGVGTLLKNNEGSISKNKTANGMGTQIYTSQGYAFDGSKSDGKGAEDSTKIKKYETDITGALTIKNGKEE